MNVNTQSNAFTVGKPACYDDMKKCATRDELIDFISNLSDNDKSGCIIYAMFEPADNANYIEALAQNIKSLAPTDMKTLMTLAATDKLDRDNVHSMLKTQTPLSTKLSIILES